MPIKGLHVALCRASDRGRAAPEVAAPRAQVALDAREVLEPPAGERREAWLTWTLPPTTERAQAGQRRIVAVLSEETMKALIEPRRCRRNEGNRAHPMLQVDGWLKKRVIAHEGSGHCSGAGHIEYGMRARASSVKETTLR